jgi:hypothetical protein
MTQVLVLMLAWAIVPSAKATLIGTVPTNATCGVSGCDSLSHETNTNFFGSLTPVGFREDESSVPGGSFVDVTVTLVTADRDTSGDSSTDATDLSDDHESVIDDGETTEEENEPAVPEPASLLLVGGGLLALGGVRRFGT